MRERRGAPTARRKNWANVGNREANYLTRDVARVIERDNCEIVMNYIDVVRWIKVLLKLWPASSIFDFLSEIKEELPEAATMTHFLDTRHAFKVFVQSTLFYSMHKNLHQDRYRYSPIDYWLQQVWFLSVFMNMSSYSNNFMRFQITKGAPRYKTLLDRYIVMQLSSRAGKTKRRTSLVKDNKHRLQEHITENLELATAV